MTWEIKCLIVDCSTSSVARAWKRSGCGCGKRVRGSVFFKKWPEAKRGRKRFYIYIYINIYIFKRKHVECQTRCKIYETCMFVILPIYEMPSRFHIIHHSIHTT